METDPVLKDRFSRIAFQTSLALLLAQTVVLLATWRHLPPQVPLFYSHPWGEEQLAPPQGLLLLPGLSLAVTLANFFLGLLFAKRQKLAKQILSATAAIFNLLCLFTLIQIIRLVI